MLFLTPADLRGLDARAVEELLGRSGLVIALGAGEVRGLAAAALLFADYAVLDRDASLIVDEPEAWAAVAWRLGRRAIAWSVRGAVAAEVVDEITELDAESWRERWMRGRSALALDSAAELIRRRGGDALERAEFARLFAISEPQRGLRAFLAKQKPPF
ncbi:MAG TPA: hypothetical protein VF846_00225 [Thermoanaerobaculia bacterium]